MKRITISLLSILLIINCVYGSKYRKKVRGSGHIVQEERQVASFSSIELTTMADVFIKISDTEKLIIETDDNLIDFFITEVRNGNLLIKKERNVNVRPTKGVRIYLTARALDQIEISSSGDIEAPVLEADHFKINISSSGDLDMEGLYAKSLEMRISSSGDVRIHKGKLERQDINLSSSGDYKAGNVVSNQVTARLSSSGDATVNVQEYLKATLSSSGDLRYIGDPKVEVRESSSGDVKKIRD